MYAPCTRWLSRMQPRPRYLRLNDPHNEFTAPTHLRRYEDQMSSGDVQSPRAGVPGVKIIQQLDIFHLQNGIYWLNHSYWDNIPHLGCGDVLHDALL